MSVRPYKCRQPYESGLTRHDSQPHLTVLQSIANFTRVCSRRKKRLLGLRLAESVEAACKTSSGRLWVTRHFWVGFASPSTVSVERKGFLRWPEGNRTRERAILASSISANMQTLYETLGLPKTAKPEQIKGAYRMLVKRFHPDLFPSGSDRQLEAGERLRQINAAYGILSNSQRRSAHDAKNKKGKVAIRRA